MSFTRFRLTTLVVAALIGVAGTRTSLHAQQVGTSSGNAPGIPAAATATIVAPNGVAATPLGPRNARAGIDPRAATVAPLVPQERNLGAGTNIALMGAGAAAVIVGLVIGGEGGTLIAISGGVLGLVGLFRYIR